MHTLANLSMNLLYMCAIGEVNNNYAHFGESTSIFYIIMYATGQGNDMHTLANLNMNLLRQVNNKYAHFGESQNESFTYVRYWASE